MTGGVPYSDLAAEIRGLGEKRDWWIEGAIVGRPKIVITGSEKAGKSFVAIDLVVALQLGGKWLDRWQVNWPGAAVYFDAEYGAPAFAERLAATYRGHGLSDLDEICARAAELRHLDSRLLTLEPGKELKALCRDFQERPPAVIIVDPFRNHLPGGANENDSDVIVSAFRAVEELRQAAGGCPVVILHHVNKKGTSAGSRAIQSVADLLINGEGEPGTWLTYSATGRFVQPGDEIAGPWQAVPAKETERQNPQRHALRMTAKAPGEAAAARTADRAAERAAAVLEAVSKGAQTVTALREATGLNGKRVSEAVEALLQSGRLVKTMTDDGWEKLQVQAGIADSGVLQDFGGSK